MKILVLGLWHLGCVTAACCARHFHVTAVDFEADVVAGLQSGQPPVFEPGLTELLHEGVAAGRLSFASDPAPAAATAAILWLAYDTPVDDEDVPDVEFVLERARKVLPLLNKEALVVISSQLPVGTCARLEAEFPGKNFVVSPENLRLGRAIEAFTQADRVVVGLRPGIARKRLEALFAPFTQKMLFVRTESAEMVKHGLNAFLALSISFINEIARMAEHFGADAAEVSRGLKSDVRIGQRAYLRAGAAFAGGTLARDVVTLRDLAREQGEDLVLIPAILESNAIHQQWAVQVLERRLGSLGGKEVSVLGLTYTPNTSTLRRSSSLELCRDLLAGGARVRAYDPAIQNPLPGLPELAISGTLAEALGGVDAVVVCTEWPQFLSAPWPDLLPLLARPLVLDPNRFLENSVASVAGVEYVSVGRA